MEKPAAVLVFLFMLSPIRSSDTLAQWDGAEARRLTYNTSRNEIEGLHLGNDNSLFLFYRQWKWDPSVQPYRDTLMAMFKEVGSHWSEPEKIGHEPFDLWAFDKYLTYDPGSKLTHIFYSSYPYLGRAETLYYWNSEIGRYGPVKVDWLDSTYGQEYHSLATEVDTSGNVHVAWHVDYDSAGYSWYRVMYANNSTGEWVKQQVSQPIFLGGFGSGPTYFDVQKNGTVHIVYETVLGSGTSYYARNDSLNGDDWHTDTISRPPRPLYYYGGAIIKADVNDRLHLITGGCIEQDCLPEGKVRRFYYYKDSQDTTWTGPELILDSLYEISRVFIDRQSTPYVMEWSPYDHCRYFGGRD